MIIDVHTHPWLMKETYENEKQINESKSAVGWGLMSTHDIELTRTSMKEAHVDKMVLLPLDLTSQLGYCIPTNEKIKELVDQAPDLFYGFCSIDPYSEDAMDKLKDAFENLHLCGLKLNPSRQHFYPNDKMMWKIYEMCNRYNKPILFHAGMSWEPDAPMKYSEPKYFEDIAIQFPKLRICLAHFGWPWIYETTALLLKYPNVFADTAMLYMDSPKQFMHDVFEKQMGELWLENNIKDQVMFGSNTPRFKTRRIKYGLDQLNLRPATREKIMGLNAMRFLGIEGENK